MAPADLPARRRAPPADPALMLLPQTAEYALRAVVHVARHAEAGPVRVPTMAAALALPRNYLSKTLHQLARAGVLASARGPAGGFRLAVPADALTLDRIVAVFGDTGARRCLLADRPCGQDPGCPVHQRWAPVSARLHGFFRSTTVADLVAGGAPDVAALVAGDAPAGFPAPPSPGPTTGPRA